MKVLLLCFSGTLCCNNK